MELTSSGVSVQAMDSSHVCLVFLELDAGAFDPFRCDKNITLGVSTAKWVWSLLGWWVGLILHSRGCG